LSGELRQLRHENRILKGERRGPVAVSALIEAEKAIMP
jgi:hypothetical protein